MLNTAFIVAHAFHHMDRKNKAFTAISTTAYVVLPVESGLATSAFIMSARKLVKKMTRHPCYTLKSQRRWDGKGMSIIDENTINENAGDIGIEKEYARVA